LAVVGVRSRVAIKSRFDHRHEPVDDAELVLDGQREVLPGGRQGREDKRQRRCRSGAAT
jgi:hypothetical protein